MPGLTVWKKISCQGTWNLHSFGYNMNNDAWVCMETFLEMWERLKALFGGVGMQFPCVSYALEPRAAVDIQELQITHSWVTALSEGRGNIYHPWENFEKNLKVIWNILAKFIVCKIMHLPPPIKLFHRICTIHTTPPGGGWGKLPPFTGLAMPLVEKT